MTAAGDDRVVERWGALDGALDELQSCRTAQDIERSACALARRACGAEQATLGTLRAGTWWTWCRDPGSGSPPVTADLADQAGDGSAARPASIGDGPVEEELGEGRRRVVVAVPATGVRWLLELVLSDHDCDDVGRELAASFAASLGRVMAAAAVLQRAEEQRFVLGRLTSAVSSAPERTIELVDGAAPEGTEGPPGAHAGADSASPFDDRLSARQREVLDLLVRGLSNAEIAERLVVSVPTVKSHVRAVLRACGAVNRSEAITRLARGDGLPR